MTDDRPVPPPIVADNAQPELDPRALDMLARAVVIADGTGWDALPMLMLLDSDFDVLDVITSPDIHPAELCRIIANRPEGMGSPNREVAAALMVSEGYVLDPSTGERTGEETRTFTLSQRDRNSIAYNVYRFAAPKAMWIDHIEGRVSEALESILSR